ncbi:DUF3306 domain-containing protein [Novimethylophilus sp.]|uniref:DUF3306 domain-containing protein n=1 Tax=Novimethylophilus sp. TaxID=2137426 RepID=UPI002F4156C4
MIAIILRRLTHIFIEAKQTSNHYFVKRPPGCRGGMDECRAWRLCSEALMCWRMNVDFIGVWFGLRMCSVIKFHFLTRDQPVSHPKSFLRRWSRLKIQSASPVAAPQPAAEAHGTDADVSALLRPEVERGVRQAALRKFFMSDRYRVMDGLDVYVDDYSSLELLPAALLGRLVHATALLSAGELEQETSTIPKTSPELQK